MSPNPRVSVCLTAYQRSRAIGQTIESILAQDFSDFELLIQDDASTDATEDVCRTYERQDSRVHYRRNASNLAMPGNLNAVIARAKAPLIANLHDGDLYRPDLLTKWIDAIEDAQAAFVFNALEVITLDGVHVCYQVPAFGQRIEPGTLVQHMMERLTSPVWGTVMARRSAYNRVGAFKERYSFYADVEMWMRLNLEHPVAYVAEPLIRITPHEPDRPYNYVNWAMEKIHIDMRNDIADAFYHLDERGRANYRDRLDSLRVRRWLWLAGSCLKRGRLDLLSQGLELFRRDTNPVLRAAGHIGWPAMTVRRLWGPLP